jgi:4,5-dihydroxyphthalate decarboxylase
MLRLSVATSYYDRVAPLIDGRIRIDGCDSTHILIDAPGEIFHRAFMFEEFDITELSLSSHMLTTVRGDAKYLAIPAFPLRMFRHSGIYIRTDRGIAGPQDLRGKTVGLPEYQQTANVWVRGFLEDEYGVDIRSVRCAPVAGTNPVARSARRSVCPRTSTGSRFRPTARSRICWRPARSTH